MSAILATSSEFEIYLSIRSNGTQDLVAQRIKLLDRQLVEHSFDLGQTSLVVVVDLNQKGQATKVRINLVGQEPPMLDDINQECKIFAATKQSHTRSNSSRWTDGNQAFAARVNFVPLPDLSVMISWSKIGAPSRPSVVSSSAGILATKAPGICSICLGISVNLPRNLSKYSLEYTRLSLRLPSLFDADDGAALLVDVPRAPAPDDDDEEDDDEEEDDDDDDDDDDEEDVWEPP
jgi:hypothetical protein